MLKAVSPPENACEPEEGAYQPLENMSLVPKNKERKTASQSFAGSEILDSQSAPSSYKDVLSQPADCMTHRQRLHWLQKRRLQGLWAQCDACNRWRYLPTVLDRYDLPTKWYCNMNPDTKLASCSAPEVPIRIRDEEDLIYSEYSPGSLVVARLHGWPWWPAMVDDCPDTEQYYWLDGLSDIPTHYHVVFFDSCEVTRAWIAPNQLKPFKRGKRVVDISLTNKSYRKRLEVAIKQANEAEKLTQNERLIKYSFLARYKGNITSPKKITKNKIKVFQKQFQKKFPIALPNELFDSDDENQSTELSKKSKAISIGCNTNSTTIKHSLIVEVDTYSNLARTADMMETNDTSTTYVPDTTANTVEDQEALEAADRAGSPDSEDFVF